jgi:hypothetical protein
MEEKQKGLKAKIVFKHELEKDWLKSNNYVPLEGEQVFYDAETSEEDLPEGRNYLIPYVRSKFGDGVHTVNELPFAKDDYLEIGYGENAVQMTGNIAGVMGYYYSHITFTDETHTTGKICLTDTRVCPIEGEGELDPDFETPDYQSGGRICIVNGSKYDYGTYGVDATVVSVDHNILTYEGNIGFTASKLPTELGDDLDIDDFTIFVIDNPMTGAVSARGRAFAVGEDARALGLDSHAEGKKTLAYGNFGHAEGRETVAGYISHAEGKQSKAYGQIAHAEGLKTEAHAQASHTEGCETKALKDYSHAEGYQTTADGLDAHAEGRST